MVNITVIIPVYNSEIYVSECLESVKKQEVLEILVVDADSTDQTCAIVQETAKEDGRIRLMHSEKKSYGYQLNQGIEAAQGEYIAIVESDDLILPRVLQELYRIARECDADYVKGDFENFLEAANKSYFTCYEDLGPEVRHVYNKVIRPLDYPEIYVRDLYLWKGIYKSDFLKSKQIRFHETPGAAYQDVGFLFQVFSYAQRAVYVNKAVYCYRRNNQGSSTYNRKAFQYLEREYAYIEDELIEKNGCNPIKASYYYKRLFQQCVSRFRLMGASGEYWEEAEDDILALRGMLQMAYEAGILDAGIFGQQLWLEFLMFLRGIDHYVIYNIQLIGTKLDEWRNIKKALERYQEIVFVSASPLNQYLFTLLNKDELDRVQVFCDKNTSKWGSVLMGKQVCSYEKAVAMYPHAAYIIANNHYKPEMKYQLVHLGVDEKDIFIYALGMDWLMTIV